MITTDQYNRLLQRVTKLENTSNDIIVAMDAYITLGQMNQLLTLLQTDLDDVTSQVTALEARVTSIENEPLNG